MQSKYIVALCGTASLLALAATQPAVAQSSDQPAATGGSGLEEIVVTARRKEERVQSVPLAITAFSQADLERQHITEVRDLGRSVPSLAISTSQSDQNAPYSSQTRLRGLPGSIIYFAEVPLGNVDYQNGTGLIHGLAAGFYYDLDHLEVDKGPQGTLFGKNSIGGLISIEPKRPTNGYEGYGKITLGDYNNRELEAAVNIPIVEDKLLVRIAGQRKERDGYTTDYFTGKDYDNQDYWSWRIGVTFRPTDDFENYLLYDGYYQDSNGSSVIARYVDPNHVVARLNSSFGPVQAGDPTCQYTITLGTGAGVPPGGCGTARLGLYPTGTLTGDVAKQQQLGVRTELGHSVQGIGKDYFYGITDTATWDITEDLTLKNIFAARVFKQLSTTDDFGAGGLAILNIGVPGNQVQWNDNSAQYTEELQLRGKALNDKLSWVLGGFLEYDHPIGSTLFGSTALGGTLAGQTQQLSINNFARSQAAFVHGIYDLSDYVEGLRFTAGYRYTWDYASAEERAVIGSTSDIKRNAAGAPTNCTEPTIMDRNCHLSFGGNFSSFGWNLGLDEQLTPNTLIYLRSGNAYRPGGFNLNAPLGQGKFQPEHVTDVEIGVKSEWELFGVHARTNVDVYHTDYKAIQIAQTVRTDVGVNNLLTNAGAATIQGGEFEASFSPFKGLDISPHASIIDAQYDKYPIDPANGITNPKPSFQYVPKFQYAVTGTYHLPIDETLGDVAMSATYSWYGNQHVSVRDDEIFPIQPSYEQLDISVDWTNALGYPVDAGFYITNALDTTHIGGVFPIYGQLGFTSVVYNEPRMFGFSLKYRFSANE